MLGTILDFGSSPYKFEEGASESYFIKLDTNQGTKYLWSLGLQEALDKTEISKGDFVHIKHTGKQPVEIPISVNDNGKTVTKFVTKHKSSFSITKARQNEQKNQKVPHAKTSRKDSNTIPNKTLTRDQNEVLTSLTYVGLGMCLCAPLLITFALLFG